MPPIRSYSDSLAEQGTALLGELDPSGDSDDN
jgi:hypothetical protein